MNRQEVLAFVSNIEKCYPTNKWKKHGIHVWPIIRIYLSMYLCLQETPKEIYLDNKPLIKLNFLDKIRALTFLCRSLFIKTDALFIGTNNYRVNVGKFWMNKFYDIFALILIKNKKNVIIAELGSKEHKKYFNYKYLFFLDAFKWIYFKVYRHTKKIHGENSLDGFNDFVSQSYKLLEFDSKESFEKAINVHIKRVFWEANYYYWLMRIISPKIVLGLNYYNSQMLGLNIACNKLQIPSVDIQHGGIGKLHFAYYGWDDLPKLGYEALPKYYWTWSTEEADLINSWGNKTAFHKAICYENPWVFVFKDETIYKTFFDSISHNLPKNLILVSLQSIKFKDLNHLASIILNTKSKFNWAFRVHPTNINSIQEIKLQLDSFGIENCYIIEEASHLSLPIILKNTLLNITEFSGVCLEASEFGVKTIITCDYGVELYPHLFERKIAFRGYLNNEDEFINLIYKISESQKNSIHPKFIGSNYFLDIYNNLINKKEL